MNLSKRGGRREAPTSERAVENSCIPSFFSCIPLQKNLATWLRKPRVPRSQITIWHYNMSLPRPPLDFFESNPIILAGIRFYTPGQPTTSSCDLWVTTATKRISCLIQETEHNSGILLTTHFHYEDILYQQMFIMYRIVSSGFRIFYDIAVDFDCNFWETFRNRI